MFRHSLGWKNLLHKVFLIALGSLFIPPPPPSSMLTVHCSCHSSEECSKKVKLSLVAHEKKDERSEWKKHFEEKHFGIHFKLSYSIIIPLNAVMKKYKTQNYTNVYRGLNVLKKNEKEKKLKSN